MKPIICLGEAFGANEAKLGYGFVGASGVELLRMLHDADLLSLSAEDRSFISRFWNSGDPACIDAVWRLHPELHRANVFPFHPLGNDMAELYGDKREAIRGYPLHRGGKRKKTGYIRAEFIPYLEALADEISSLDPNLIICLGNTPLWALAGITGISKIRGTTRLSTHTALGYKLLPTYHPSAVLQQWELRPTAVMDLQKAAREAEFPEVRRPKREIWIEPELEDIERFINDHIIGCEILSIDIETSGSRVTCIGFAPSPRCAIVVPFDDERRRNRSYWPDKQTEIQVWRLLESVLSSCGIPKVFQNGLYDIAFLWRSVGTPVMGALHDTMLLHHALQPESLKGLAFLGSIYSDEGPWKSERKVTTIKADQ